MGKPLVAQQHKGDEEVISSKSSTTTEGCDEGAVPTIQSERNIASRSPGCAGFVLGKAEKEFRNYQDSDRHRLVENHYREMRRHQSLAFVERMEAKWGTFDRAQMTIKEAFTALEGYVDSSDPDSDMPNLEHMLQTAEAIRKAGHPDWFQLVGLLHDLGKIQYIWGTPEDGQAGTASGPQWALSGDTWIVGCKLPSSAVFPEFHKLHPDHGDATLDTELGIYQEHCGIDNVKFAWGHDEYMYQMLKHNKCAIPEEGLAMIRLHSCYPWHKGGDYRRFMVEKDYTTMDWVLKFNEFDLYTKSDERPDPDKLWPYYQGLIDKYCPGKLWW